MHRYIAAFLIAVLTPIGANAGTVNLQLNDIGVAGLEAALDIARKNGSMHDADMAVSLWNALQQAKVQAMQADLAQQKANADQATKLNAQIEDLKKQLEDAKKPAAPPPSQDQQP